MAFEDEESKESTPFEDNESRLPSDTIVKKRMVFEL